MGTLIGIAVVVFIAFAIWTVVKSPKDEPGAGRPGGPGGGTEPGDGQEEPR